MVIEVKYGGQFNPQIVDQDNLIYVLNRVSPVTTKHNDNTLCQLLPNHNISQQTVRNSEVSLRKITKPHYQYI